VKRVLLLLILISLLSISITAAQETLVISPALASHLDSIEAITSEIRGLDVLTPVARHFPTREEVQAFLQTAIGEQLDDETVHNELQFYVAFDWLTPNVDLRDLYLDLLGAQVAGYYDSDTKVMNTILITGQVPEDDLPLMEQIIYSHEFTHALQDQHFGLEAIGMDTDAEFLGDPTLAMQALVEGDATYVMQIYTLQVTQENPLAAAAELLLSGAQAGGLSLPAGTPPILGAELMFPYIEGMNFVSALYTQGGWDLVNAAYSNLPQSSEHILHPQKYLDGENPQPVTLAEANLGDGWELVMDRVFGEFYMRQYLLTQLPSREANVAAEGWGGDRFHIYYNAETEQRAWVMALTWDTPQDAAEFEAAYLKWGEARFEGDSREGDCWISESLSLCVVFNEDTSRISAAPTQEMALDLLSRQ
jgi:hypothetical protein